MYSSFVSKKVFLTFALFAAVAASATSAFAQAEQPSQITIQGTGLFTTSLKDQNPSYDATKSGGFLAGYSYQFDRNFGVEGNYGWSRNTQNYNALNGSTSLQSDIHEATGSLVWHIRTGIPHFRPYALGGGANFDITSKFGFRAEYRGLAYKAPDFQLNSLNIDKFTHLAQPSVGFYARF